MDRAPQPGIPERSDPEDQEAVSIRKRRFLSRLRGFGRHNEGEVDLTPDLHSEQSDLLGEVWSRDSEPAVESEALDSAEAGSTDRAQQLGGRVLKQSWAVHDFTHTLGETVDALPVASREAVAPEAERLQTATGDLREAAEELDEELEELGGVTSEAASRPNVVEKSDFEPARPETPEKAEPKRDMSEAMSMARLVIATLIGGGLGVLMGGEAGKKERAQAKEKAKTGKTTEQQKAKIASQEAELKELKAKQPEAGKPPEKEFVKKASELAEKQVELTHTTVEQVRAVTKEAAEVDKTFKIPEQKSPEAASAERAEHAEQLQGERQDTENKQAEQPLVWPRQQVEQPVIPSPQSRPELLTTKPKLGVASPKAWTYGVLLAVAMAVAVGLLLFGPK